MGIGRKTLLAWGASLAVLAFGAPVFASGAHPGSLTAGPLTSNGSNTSNCKFYVNEIQVTSAPTFPMSQFTLAITVNDQTSGTWFFPDPSQVSNNPQALPKVEIKEGSTVVDASVSPTSIKKPIPSVTTNGGQATAYYKYVLSPSLPTGNYTVSLVETNSGTVFHMYSSPTNQGLPGVNTAPVCGGTPGPTGQLPEVPYAAAIPLAGLALGGLVWYRRTRLSA